MTEIPKDHFVVGCDLDAEEPWFEIVHNDAPVQPRDERGEIRILIPKELALYLNTHWCGSKKMHRTIRENMRREIANAIKDALGLQGEDSSR